MALAGCLTVLASCGALGLTVKSARAYDTPPSAERLRSAASEYDAGRRAFTEKDYEGAATHFENAFRDAANVVPLRNAIRARKKAGQLARAATLAYVASVRYATDAQTAVLVREVLAESASKLDRVTLGCSPACGVAVDGKAIAQEDATDTVFYLDPGSHDMVVSWGDDRTKRATLTAKAGGQDQLTFEAPPKPASVVVPVVAPVAAVPAPPPPAKGLTPIVFLSGAGLTAGALGVTIWSGIDTLNNPGTAAVQKDCKGLGTSCAQYQQGRNAQLRTNVLIGTTAGLAAATAVVGIFFTRWSHGADEKALPGRPGRPVDATFSPLPGGGAVVVFGAF